jgi:hypothetical protein
MGFRSQAEVTVIRYRLIDPFPRRQCPGKAVSGKSRSNCREWRGRGGLAYPQLGAAAELSSTSVGLRTERAMENSRLLTREELVRHAIRCGCSAPEQIRISRAGASTTDAGQASARHLDQQRRDLRQ